MVEVGDGYCVPMPGGVGGERDAGGWAGWGGKSVLGYLLESSGVSGFFDKLSEMGDAAFLDTRVIFNHAGKSFSASDRFYSDMLEEESVADPWLREFTLGAREAAIPVILGGAFAGVGGDAGAY